LTTWPTLQAGLTALFATLSGLPAGMGGPNDGKISFPAKDLRGEFEFRIVSNAPVGIDERRRDYDPDAEVPGDEFEVPDAPPGTRLGGFIYSTAGNRKVTIEFRVDCRKVTVGARDFVEAVANKIQLPTARASLRELGLALASVGPVVDAVGGFDEHGRAVSAYVVEIFCNAAASVADTPITTIEQIEVEAIITGRSNETE